MVIVTGIKSSAVINSVLNMGGNYKRRHQFCGIFDPPPLFVIKARVKIRHPSMTPFITVS